MARLLSLALLVALAAPVLAQHDDGDYYSGDFVRVPVNVALWKGISLGDAVADGRPVLHHVSFNLPSGRAARLEGIALGLFSTEYETSSFGVQIAGLANVTGERAEGIQVSGLANVVGDKMRGVQLAGLANVVGEEGGYVQVAGLASIAGDELVGLQVAGLASIVGERFGGIQASGLASLSGGSFFGIQTSGLASIAGETMTGIQWAGLAAITGEDLVGIQASLFNIVGEHVRGAQVGLVNVAGERSGLQLGVLNVAGEEGGLPVGLYSRVDRVPVWLTVGTDETAALHIGVRSGSWTVANHAGISIRPFSDAAFRWGVFAGLGVEQPLGRRATWGVDGIVHGLFAEDLGGWGGTLVRLRAVLTRDLGDRLALYGGPAFSLFLSDDEDGSDLAPFSVWDDGPDPFVRAWPGIEAGLRVRLGS